MPASMDQARFVLGICGSSKTWKNQRTPIARSLDLKFLKVRQSHERV